MAANSDDSSGWSARYCFCLLSWLTWVAWEYIAAYGKHSLIRIGDQPPLLQDLAIIT